MSVKAVVKDLPVGEPVGVTTGPSNTGWLLVILSSVVMVIVLGHTLAIAFSTVYMLGILHAPIWLMTLVRMMFASFVLIVGFIVFFADCGRHPLTMISVIIVYLGCLIEPYGQSLWVCEEDFSVEV